MKIDEIIKCLIAGAKVKVCPYGTVIDTNTVSAVFKPATNSPAYVSIGRSESAIPVRDNSPQTITQFEDDGSYEGTDVSVITSNKFQFTTRDLSFMALQLMFGLEKDDEGNWKPWKGSGSKDVWMQLVVTDAQTREDIVAMEFTGKLTLSTITQLSINVVSSTFQLAVVPNDLVTAEGIVEPVTP